MSPPDQLGQAVDEAVRVLVDRLGMRQADVGDRLRKRLLKVTAEALATSAVIRAQGRAFEAAKR